jgi:Uma2 family endonuclease
MLYALAPNRGSSLRHEVDPYPRSWFIEDDEKVPQARSHYLCGGRLEGLLLGWKNRSGRDVQVGRELALRWDEKAPQVGVDPDVYVVEPPPPEGDRVTSLKTWQPGHHPPLLAVEVVSTTRPGKDYGSSPLKYGASGTQELWVFDPELCGPKAQEGPFRIQVWRRSEQGKLTRVYAGEGPVYSEAIDGWVFVVDEGRALAIADDEAGTRGWLTPEETERAAKEAAQAAAAGERVAKEAAQARAERLAAMLRALGMDPETSS